MTCKVDLSLASASKLRLCCWVSAVLALYSNFHFSVFQNFRLNGCVCQVSIFWEEGVFSGVYYNVQVTHQGSTI